jgi:hypothetical protein
MTSRVRKLIGTVVLFALVLVWTLTAMALAQTILASAGAVLSALYYAVAGLGWVLPAVPLVSWMLRPDRWR